MPSIERIYLRRIIAIVIIILTLQFINRLSAQQLTDNQIKAGLYF